MRNLGGGLSAGKLLQTQGKRIIVPVHCKLVRDDPRTFVSGIGCFDSSFISKNVQLIRIRLGRINQGAQKKITAEWVIHVA